MVLDVPAEFWNKLEANYQDKAVRAITENEMDDDIELTKDYPYSAMAKYGWVPETQVATEKVFCLRRFFEVAKLEIVGTLPIPGIAYRRSGVSQTSDYALAAWAQQAKIEARKIDTALINLRQLEDSLEEIRKMTTQDIAVFCPNLTRLLASCGVAVVFLPHIGGSFLHGASFCDGDHIVMGLTVRGKDADNFWFSLFHELCHILRGHINSKQESTENQERDADAFARDTLIPTEMFEMFVECNKNVSISEESIVSFANRCHIDNGIVVGRLQKENLIPYNRFNNLKTKYQIS
ncbi:hypothetical protein FACS1894167_15740 [Synergistales bacterium]|nr:hypothetical protein FACS1894167_15740 [Synergistales bacterium]